MLLLSPLPPGCAVPAPRCASRRRSSRAVVPLAPSSPPPRPRPRALVVARSSPEQLFDVATLCVLPVYALMAAFPRSRRLRAALLSPWPWLGLAALYAHLLAASWREDTLSLMFSLSAAHAPLPALPTLASVGAMFARPAAAAASWVHLLSLDLFLARFVYLDAARRRVVAAHSLALCCLAGPLGLACHGATAALAHAVRSRARAARAGTATGRGGGERGEAGAAVV